MFCEKLPVLTVEDLSKFGTTVGEKHLTKEKATILSGDTIWFGNLNADNSRFVLVLIYFNINVPLVGCKKR